MHSKSPLYMLEQCTVRRLGSKCGSLSPAGLNLDIELTQINSEGPLPKEPLKLFPLVLLHAASNLQCKKAHAK